MTGKSRRLTLAAITWAFALGAVPGAAHADEPSPEFRAGLRRTAELRKQRRRDRTARPVGVIVPYPFPPALIIRHKPEVHHEVRSLLDLLRR
jgi:hypothetical protein